MGNNELPYIATVISDLKSEIKTEAIEFAQWLIENCDRISITADKPYRFENVLYNLTDLYLIYKDYDNNK